MSREYRFALPYQLSSFELSMGMGQLQSEGVWDNLPKDFRKKLQQASQGWDGYQITEEDCDSIDNDTFATIAGKLGLEYTQYEDEEEEETDETEEDEK